MLCDMPSGFAPIESFSVRQALLCSASAATDTFAPVGLCTFESLGLGGALPLISSTGEALRRENSHSSQHLGASDKIMNLPSFRTGIDDISSFFCSSPFSAVFRHFQGRHVVSFLFLFAHLHRHLVSLFSEGLKIMDPVRIRNASTVPQNLHLFPLQGVIAHWLALGSKGFMATSTGISSVVRALASCSFSRFFLVEAFHTCNHLSLVQRIWNRLRRWTLFPKRTPLIGSSSTFLASPLFPCRICSYSGEKPLPYPSCFAARTLI